MDLGNEFHYFGAELEKKRSYSAVCDLEIDRRPFSVDLSMRLWVVEIGFSKLLIKLGLDYSKLCK